MQPTIAPILPQPVDALPRVTPGENFSNMISDAFKLANAGGKIPTFNLPPPQIAGTVAPGAPALTGRNLVQSISTNPNLTEAEKNDTLKKMFAQDLQADNAKIRGSEYVKREDVEKFASSDEIPKWLQSGDWDKLGYRPYADNDARYQETRGFWNSYWKILDKFLVSTAVGGASNITPVAWGLDHLLGSNSSQSIANTFAAWQEAAAKTNQIYYNKEEQDATGFNPIKDTTKFFDSLLPSLGFTVGNAVVSYVLLDGLLGVAGSAASKGMNAVTATAKGDAFITALGNAKLSGYKGLKLLNAETKPFSFAGEIQDVMTSVKGATDATASTLEAGGWLGKGIHIAGKATEGFVKTLPYSIYSAMGEAHIEAATAKQEFINNSIQEYKDKNGGAMPDANFMVNIMTGSSKIYDKTLKYNTVVLAITNTFEMGAILNKFGILGHLMNNKTLRAFGKFLKADDIKFSTINKAWEKKTWKELAIPYSLATVVEAAGESFEEGSQFAISNGLQSWAKQKYLYKDAKNIKKEGLDTIFDEWVVSRDNFGDEFNQNAFFGGISGLLMGGGTKIAKGIKQSYSKDDPAAERIKVLNSAVDVVKRGATGEFLEASDTKLNHFEQNAKEMKEAAKNNNIFALKNIEFSNFFTWVATSISAGGFDLRLEQLKDLKSLKGESFKEYFGLEHTVENEQIVKDYIDKVSEEAKSLAYTIENFRDIQNIYEFTPEKEGRELTAAQKEENELFNNFNSIKSELAYRYARVENLEKRGTSILKTLESQFGGTSLTSTLKNILFNANGASDYKKQLVDEIKQLKEEATTFQEGGGIFLDEYKAKVRAIKHKESLLNAMTTTQSDYERLVNGEGEGSVKLDDDQKQVIIRRANEIKNMVMLNGIMNYELTKIKEDREKNNLPFEVEHNGKKLSSIEDIKAAMEESVHDLYAINRTKGVVLDSANKMNTRRGIDQFVREYVDLKTAFENGKSTEDLKKDRDSEFRKELQAIIKSAGYPDPNDAIGVTITRFVNSKETIENLPDHLKRLDEAKAKALSNIQEVTFKDDKGVETIKYKTTIDTPSIGKKELIGDTKEIVTKRVENEYEKALKSKPSVLNTANYKIERVNITEVDKKSKKRGVVVKYTIRDEEGKKAFSNKELFSAQEITDFLSDVNNAQSAYGIVKFKVMPYSEFQDFRKRERSFLEVDRKLKEVISTAERINNRIKEIDENPIIKSPDFKESFIQIMQDNYYRLYGYLSQLKELDNTLLEIQDRQAKASEAYSKLHTSGKFSSTKENKAYIAELNAVKSEISDVTAKFGQYVEELDSFRSENEKHAEYYDKYKEIAIEYSKLLNDRESLLFYHDYLKKNRKDLEDHKTVKHFGVNAEIQMLEEKFIATLVGTTDEEIKKAKAAVEEAFEKENQIRDLGAVYSETIRVYTNRIKINEAEIKKLEDSIAKLNALTAEELKAEGGSKKVKALIDTQLANIEEYKRKNIILKDNVDKITNRLEADIKALTEQNINAYNVTASMLDAYRKLEEVRALFEDVARNTAIQKNLAVTKGLSENPLYHSQRNWAIGSGGERVELDPDPEYEALKDKFKPDDIYQLTGQDILAATFETEIDGTIVKKPLFIKNDEGNIIMNDGVNDEIIEKNVPQLEYYRFLSNFSSEYISENFSTLLVTPAFVKKQTGELYKSLQQAIESQYKGSEMNEDQDLFAIIVDKKTGEFIQQNEKFLITSFYKTENKFSIDEEGKPNNITEKRLLDIYKTSPQYEADVKSMIPEQIEEYINKPETLISALQFAKEKYDKDIKFVLQQIESDKVVISHIDKVTEGIFAREKTPNSVASVMGITKENVHDFSLAIVKKDSKIDKSKVGGLSYIGEDGAIHGIGENLPIGMSAIVNKKTGQWVPLNQSQLSERMAEQVLGIMYYAMKKQAEAPAGQSILDTIKLKIPYGPDIYQMFSGNEGQFIKEKAIPLFPINQKLKSKNGAENYSKRWSIMTTLLNWGHDPRNNRNSIFFTEEGNLRYFSPSSKKMIEIPYETLNRILEAHSTFNKDSNIADLSDVDVSTLNDLSTYLQTKYNNISLQYGLNSSNKKTTFKFLFPKYDAKTNSFSFKMYDSYLEYVLGLSDSKSAIVSTNVTTVDGRIGTQKSVFLQKDKDGRLIIREPKTGLPSSVRDVSVKSDKKAEKAEKIEPTKTTATKVDIKDLKKETPPKATSLQNVVYYDTSTDRVIWLENRTVEESIEEPIVGYLILEELKNESNRTALQEIMSNADKIPDASTDFKKNLIRDQNRVIYYKLIRTLKSTELGNAKKYKEHEASRNKHNNENDTKLIEGTLVELDGVTYKLGKFIETIAGETTIMTPTGEGKALYISTETLLQGLNSGEVKVPKTTETTSKVPDMGTGGEVSIETVWNALKAAGLYTQYDSLDQYMEDGNSTDELRDEYQSLSDSKDSLVELSLERILKDNNIKKEC
jgi:hypothetical protein